MSEGRLAPVRETDRHAALVAGCAAALFSGASFAALQALHVHSDLGDRTSSSITTSFGFLLGVATALGFVLGCIEGAVAARRARRAADRFQPLRRFARKVFLLTAIANAVVASAATSTAFNGTNRVIALLFSVTVAVGASGIAAAVFAWSHAVDWPHVPDYLRKPPTVRPRDAQTASPQADAQIVDVDGEVGRREVVNEPKSRRNASTSSLDDEVWNDIQDLITGK